MTVYKVLLKFQKKYLIWSTINAIVLKFIPKDQKKGGFMKEKEIIEFLKKENPEFFKLHQEHQELEAKLEELERRHYLTPEEEIEVKRIKKQKLIKKDKMAEIIRKLKKTMEVSSEK